MTASIVVFGSESTGKTTLTHTLARRLGCEWSSEYVRDFWYANDGDIRAGDLTRIAAGQIERMATARATAAQRAERYVLHDTDLLTHVLWVDLLFPGQCGDWVRETADLQARQPTLYLLCDIDIAWADDPQRCFSDARERASVQAYFRQALCDRRLTFVTISGSLTQREVRALDAIALHVQRISS